MGISQWNLRCKSLPSNCTSCLPRREKTVNKKVIPCKECITYAKCRQSTEIKCYMLFEYVRDSDLTVTSIKQWIPGITIIMDSNWPNIKSGLGESLTPINGIKRDKWAIINF